MLLEVSDGLEEDVGNEEDVAVCDCKEVLVSVVTGDIDPVPLEVSDGLEEDVGNEEDVAVSDCKELLVDVLSGDIELVLLEVSVA